MKILIASATAFAVTPELGYGGMERLAWEFADELNKQGQDVTLFAADNTVPPDGVRLLPVGFNADPDLNREKEAYENNSDMFRQFDLIHDLTHQHYIPRFMGLSCPSISVFWHDPYLAKYPQPDHNVIALSEWAAGRFREIYFQDCKVQETILVDPQKYQFLEDQKREDWFVFIGKMSHEKGALDAIRICKELGVGLKIIGGKGLASDPDDYQKEVIKRSGGNIEYLGSVSDAIKIECLQKAKALIYPVNQMEITSHKNMEALMCGCPVVTYNHGAMFHTVEHGVTGFLATDEEEMKGFMNQIDKIRPWACHDVAMRRWAKETVVKNYLSLYEDVVNGLRWY